MSSKVHVKGPEKEESGSRTRDKDGEKPRHKSSRSKRKSSSREGRREAEKAERREKRSDSSSRRRSSMPVPELQRRGSLSSANASKTSLAYPTFSKAHSREAVGSKEHIVPPRQNVFTPDPTDLQEQAKGKSEAALPTSINTTAPNAPPSPPLTATEQATSVEDKRSDLQKIADEIQRKFKEDRAQRDNKSSSEARLQHSSTKGSPWRSSKSGEKESESPTGSLRSRTTTKKRYKNVTVEEGSSLAGKQRSLSSSVTSSNRTASKISVVSESASGSGTYSDRTSVAPDQPTLQPPYTPITDDDSSPPSNTDSSPKTPTPRGTPFPSQSADTPIYVLPGFDAMMKGNENSPMPPPPPPPPIMPLQNPKVDYLLYNGGLTHTVPKAFLSVVEPRRVMSNLPNDLDQTQPSVAAQVEKFFAPFNGLLDDYEKVVSKSGSLAVATGYRSIARRLLDRLEAVFARDIASQTCVCPMCDTVRKDAQDYMEEEGVSWGEILEYVCGRRDLPIWPAFILETSPIGLGISSMEHQTPMQKLDIDVPEEYREHYIRQSKKTKTSVDRWLNSQPNAPSSPPQDVDDDTLTFAMLTHLEPLERPAFKTLLGISQSRPASRVGTPFNVPSTSDLLRDTGHAIQRLYRLSQIPRYPESAIYLLKNPHLHNVLATLAAISDAEWEILISGRFDGFLRSGADDVPPAFASVPPSRGPTPANGQPPLPRGPTPFSAATAGAPVTLDEETEIATLAEIERDIYQGMEALEDAFEALHCKAEAVRQNLRERGAGLAMACQARRGAGADLLEARLGTPASMRGWDSETDDGMGDDTWSELAPDDSASNISSSRHRRPKRRTERRTPAPVEEVDEGSEVYTHSKSGRRR
ncbi:hypothetical protein MMC25_003641 [Agyrium rufum]|nr:hypothetical protein [Agyrium rufum]